MFFCGRSDYFRALLEYKNSEASSSGQERLSESVVEVFLNDVSPDVFAAVVAYIYQDDALVKHSTNVTFELITSRVARSGKSTRLPPMWPEFDSILDTMRGWSLLILYSALRGFNPSTSVFPAHQKPRFDPREPPIDSQFN